MTSHYSEFSSGPVCAWSVIFCFFGHWGKFILNLTFYLFIMKKGILLSETCLYETAKNEMKRLNMYLGKFIVLWSKIIITIIPWLDAAPSRHPSISQCSSLFKPMTFCSGVEILSFCTSLPLACTR